MKVYIAGSISLKSYDEVMDYFETVADRVRDLGYEVQHPMLGKDYLRTETELRSEGYKNPISTNHAIFEADRWRVQTSDIVLVNLSTADKVSIGSCMEIAWASLLGKLVIGIMPEGENVHRHAFVLEAIDILFTDLEDAISYLDVIKND